MEEFQISYVSRSRDQGAYRTNYSSFFKPSDIVDHADNSKALNVLNRVPY